MFRPELGFLHSSDRSVQAELEAFYHLQIIQAVEYLLNCFLQDLSDICDQETDSTKITFKIWNRKN